MLCFYDILIHVSCRCLWPQAIVRSLSFKSAKGIWWKPSVVQQYLWLKQLYITLSVSLYILFSLYIFLILFVLFIFSVFFLRLLWHSLSFPYYPLSFIRIHYLFLSFHLDCFFFFILRVVVKSR